LKRNIFERLINISGVDKTKFELKNILLSIKLYENIIFNINKNQ
jgi:hypothetical protein